MLAIGHAGPMLLEDAVDLAGMMITLGRTVHPGRWIEGHADGNGLAAFDY